MTSYQKIFASLVLVGGLTLGSVACSSDSKSSSGVSTEAWCKQFEAADKAEKADDESDSEAMTKAFTQLAKDAPAAVRDDMQLLASAVTDMDNIDFTDEAATAEFEKKYDEEKLDAATSRIETFVKDECGLDLNAD